MTAVTLLIVAALTVACGEDVVIGGVQLAADKPPPAARASLETRTERVRTGPGAGTCRKHHSVCLDAYRQTYRVDYSTPPCQFSFRNPLAAGVRFFTVQVNGCEPIKRTPGTVRVWEETGSASAEFAWPDPDVGLKMTMKVLDGDMRLFLRLSLTSKDEIRGVRLKIHGYPGGYPEGRDGDGVRRDRYAKTAARTARVRTYGKGEETKTDRPVKLDLDPATETWAILGDDALDPAESKRGEGAAGYLFLPEEVSEATVQLNSYDAWVLLEYPPGTRAVRLCVWGFGSRGNRIGERLLRGSAADTVTRLQEWE